ncbi:MAG: insulinase family protein [Holophagales bacterium]|nr:insulinase family protein [Holophagales bacterium]MYJ26889.1 insulinase family protein [Holophagales bacterium]
MSRVLALALLAAVVPFPGSVAAQAIPERPEDLRFAPSVFEPPPVSGLRFELGNGLPVYVVPDRGLPLVDVVVALPVGDRNEAPGEDGLASMTAAMARRGGAGESGPDELDDEIDALGARIQASSSWGRTVLVLDSGSEALDRGLELLASILFEPRFDEARVEQAKENLRVSLLAEADDPRAVLEREWLRLVHGPASPRSRRLTQASIAAFDRDALARFHRRHWSSRGAVIAASGDVDAEALVARLDELFGGWEPRPPEAAEDPKGLPQGLPVESAEPAAPAAVSPGWWTIDRPGTQAALAFGHRGALFDSWDDPGRWALMLLAEILDGPGAVSRLRSRLQLEEGLTYRVLTHFSLDIVTTATDSGRNRGMGEFRVFLETAPESTVEAASVVLEEVRRLLRDEVPENEIATARQSLLARLPLLFDRAEAIAGRYAEDELLGRPHEYWAVYRERLLAVTAADIREAARRFLEPEESVLLVIGGRKATSRDRGFDELRDALGDPRAASG